MYKIVYPDELNHFGVKGMKWGVRKEPSTSKPSQQQNAMKSTKQQKIIKAAKIGAIVVATGLAIYGGYKVNEVHKSAIKTLTSNYNRKRDNADWFYKHHKSSISDLSSRIAKADPMDFIDSINIDHWGEEKARHISEASKKLKEFNYYNDLINSGRYPTKEVIKEMRSVVKRNNKF